MAGLSRLNRINPFIYLLFTITGGTSLIFQVTWNRDLTLIFGGTRPAVSVILSAFMTGLALGAWYWGRRCETVQRPLRLYGLLELGVAFFALCFPVALRCVDGAYINAARALGDGPALQFVRIGFAFCLLLIPTTFMGGTLPVLVRHLVSAQRQMESRLPLLYGMNTLGAAAGAMLGGFILLPALGVIHTQWLIIGMNALVGCTALWLDRALTPRSAAIDAMVSQLHQQGAINEDEFTLRLAFWATAACGFSSLAMEVLWTRALVIALGSTTYNFTLMLSAFLSGIAIGGLLYRLPALHRGGLVNRLCVAMFFIGLFIILGAQFVPSIPGAALRFNQWVYGGFSGVRPLTGFTISFVVMFIPAALFGAAFPMAAEARSALQHRYGKSSGESVLINTLGAACGALSAGYLLIPMLGLQKSMLLAGVIPVIYASWMYASGETAETGERRPMIYATALTAIMAIVPFVAPEWNRQVLGSFRNNVGHAFLTREGEIDVERAVSGSTVVYYREGVEATVSVTQSDMMRSLLINGKTVATDSIHGLGLQKLMGHIPCLLHPDPRKGLVIGLGAGVTSGAAAIYPTMESLTIVEIEPAVIGGAMRFDYCNNKVLKRPNVHPLIQDGRNYLRVTNETFDVITADPIHPWAAGSTYLYTREYYQDARARLKPGGVMCQWLPLYELSTENIQSLTAAFLAVFKHVQLWRTYFDCILVGSDSPLTVDADSIRAKMNSGEVKDDLRSIDIGDLNAFLSLYVTDETELNRFCAGATVNSDDNLHVEFTSPYTVGSNTLSQNMRAASSMVNTPSSIVAPDGVERDLWLDELKAAQRVETGLVMYKTERTNEDGEDHEPSAAEITELTGLYNRAPDSLRVRRAMYDQLINRSYASLRLGEREQAISMLTKATELFTADGMANNQLAVLYAQGDRLDEAMREADLAVNRSPRVSAAWINRGGVYEAAGRLDEALDSYRQALALRPGYKLAMQKIILLQRKMRLG
ncbi:MAG: tetratricopeptide repeat protein [bacterium]|nr:tetratricopeptide repeat protein [bacterium]